jgi:hypothetical protein
MAPHVVTDTFLDGLEEGILADSDDWMLDIWFEYYDREEARQRLVREFNRVCA